MTITQAVVHGVVQGLGEFLPISSSAHLILVPWFTGWPDPGLAFDVALHMGTLAALLAHFWQDLGRIVRAGVASVVDRKIGADAERRLAWGIVVASLPAALAGVLVEDYAETVFRSPGLVAVTLIAMGLVLYAVDRARPMRKTLGQLTLRDQLLIGVAQACALVPGVSRSGATIAAARALAANRDAAARFSFLLSAPITLAAGLLEAPDMVRQGIDAPFVAGVLASGLVGYLAIRYLLIYVRTRSYGIFVYYRLALGLVILALLAS